MTNDIKAHPMPGWLAVLPSKVDGPIEQEVTQEAVIKHKARLEREINSRGPTMQVIDLNSLFGVGGPPRQQQQNVELTEDEVRDALQQSYTTFESAIVVEISKLPPGYEIEDSEGRSIEVGDKVYYYEGRDLQIGELSFVRVDQLICWA
jgi:hypothetical protein